MTGGGTGEGRMMRRKYIVGNWKMNGSMAALAELDAIAAQAASAAATVAICPPATLIAPAVARQPDLTIGGQDCHWNASGAHTGCLSPAMLAEAGARMVIVGHSERRTDNGETSEDVRKKAEAALAAGLITIVCVGETRAEREGGRAIATVEAQLEESLPAPQHLDRLIIAYEPVWAIGTGLTPTVGDVAEMHGAIRAFLQARYGEAGAGLSVLYGGSVNGDNAAELLGAGDVDGALVGGASLTAAKFAGIVGAAG
jgi:triosephosphate isomerase (TIM)